MLSCKVGTASSKIFLWIAKVKKKNLEEILLYRYSIETRLRLMSHVSYCFSFQILQAHGGDYAVQFILERVTSDY